MRGLGIGLILVGAAAFGLSLGAGSASARTPGALCALAGVALLLMDAGVRFALRRAGLGARQVGAMRSALQRGAEQAQLAIDRLRALGLDGSARIVNVTDTGGSFNRRPELDLELEIHIDGRAPYRVRQRHLVPSQLVSRVQVGAELPVKVDPDISDRLLIDWGLTADRNV